MSPEEAAFLDRICASPDDDVPRLIFADWLDERNDPRGEFIRVQVAIAHLPAGDPRQDTLTDREATLLARYHDTWVAPLRGLAAGPEFRRGFVESVNVDGRTFLKRAAELYRLAPVRHLRFLDVGSTLEWVMASPQLARLTGLTIAAQHIDDRLTGCLVDSPHLDGLRSLNIARNRIGDRGAELLARSPRFPRLTTLDLSDNSIRDRGAGGLAASVHLGNLETLELRRNELTRDGLGLLCSSPTLAELRHLGLAQNHVRAPRDWMPPGAGVVELAALDLTDNGLTEDAVSMLTALPGLSELNHLALERNEVGNVGAGTLAAWPGAAHLKTVRLANNRIGDPGARALARSPYLHQLAELDLRDNPIHDPGARAFLNAPSLVRLRWLGLPRLGLTPQMRRALAARYPG